MPAVTNIRASIARMQTKGEHVVARLRRDAERFMARSRTELLKEVRAVERRVLKAFHAATEERVTRLETRIAKLERTVEELRGPAAERAA
jgi:uncharacterized coiled-coil protein SlyX